MTSAIGMKGRGQGIARIAELKALKALQNNALPMAILSPIHFVGGSPKVGVSSDGFEATVLQDLCEALLQARDAGALSTEHERRIISLLPSCNKVSGKLTHYRHPYGCSAMRKKNLDTSSLL